MHSGNKWDRTPALCGAHSGGGGGMPAGRVAHPTRPVGGERGGAGEPGALVRRGRLSHDFKYRVLVKVLSSTK